MINLKNIEDYQGASLKRGKDFLYIPPNALLRPYISCYTITFPSEMPSEYTILPTASSTVVVSVSANDNIFSSLRGVNTKSCNVGAHANKMKLLLLIEFHSGCLYPFLPADQLEVTDNSLALNVIDKALTQLIEIELIKSDCIDSLVKGLDKIFLTRLMNCNTAEKNIGAMIEKILIHNGSISMSEISAQFFYSEKHIRRLFLQYVGTTPKTFSRIVRVNYALRLLNNSPAHLIDIAMEAGFFDQPHFIHDFKTICGISPQAYIQNMSVFYNDEFKM